MLASLALASGAPGRGLAQDATVVVALPTASLSFAPSYIAEDAKLWDRLGLKVKLTVIAGVGATSAVVAGGADFSNTAASAVLMANAHGQKLLAIGNTLDRPLIEIVLQSGAPGRGGSATADISQTLKGRTLAVDSVNGMSHAYLKYIFRRSGLDPEKDLTVAPMQPPNMLAAFQTKAVDGFAMSPPWTTIAAESGGVIAVSSPRGDLPELMPFAYNVIVARPDYCKAKADICRKLLAGYNQALAFLKDNPVDSADLLKRRFPQLKPDIVEKALEIVRSASPTTVAISDAGWSNTQEFSIAAGLLTPADRLSSFADLYTNDYGK